MRKINVITCLLGCTVIGLTYLMCFIAIFEGMGYLKITITGQFATLTPLDIWLVVAIFAFGLPTFFFVCTLYFTKILKME